VKPLLAIDGDSLAHRAYHALPKSIRLNCVVGFANMVLRLWEAEQPRAVLVGWDTYEIPTYRHEAFEPYQSGRVFEESLLEQLKLLPELVEALGLANAKAGGFEADDFLGAAVAAEEARGVGPKKAADVLREHGSLEAALEAGRFAAESEDLRLYRRIATVDASAPIPPLQDQIPTWAEASSLTRGWGLNALSERLAKLA
jgi:5'-3' exonuclease